MQILERTSPCFLLLLVLHLAFYTDAQNKPKVSLYYEAHCKYSRAFILEQLLPTYTRYKDSMILEMIPFSFIDINNQITCQHGPEECAANLAQSCALWLYGFTDSRPINYIFCMEKAAVPSKVRESCTSTAGIDWNKIKTQCLDNNNNLLKLTKYFSSLKNKLPDDKVPLFPWITINGATNQAQQDRIRKNFPSEFASILQSQG